MKTLSPRSAKKDEDYPRTVTTDAAGKVLSSQPAWHALFLPHTLLVQSFFSAGVQHLLPSTTLFLSNAPALGAQYMQQLQR